MAIYTQLSVDEVERFFGAFGLGPVRALTGIPAGSINTNYFVDTADARYFLRLSEVASEAELVYEAALLQHLARAGVPTPTLRTTRAGAPYASLRGKWGSVFDFVAGDERTAESASAADLRALGEALARMHLAGDGFVMRRPHAFELDSVSRWLAEIAACNRDDLADVTPQLVAERDFVLGARPPGLPAGVIHGDLFPDNVKFDASGRVALVFDFEMASDGVFAYDLAVALLAWCWRGGGFDWGHARAALEGYTRVRALEGSEAVALYVFARQAALRFTVTRIRDFHLRPMPASDRVHKSFRDYLSRLHALQALGAEAFVSHLRLG